MLASLIQGIALGQITGPVVTSYLVGATGQWSAALQFALQVAALTFTAGVYLGRLERA